MMIHRHLQPAPVGNAASKRPHNVTSHLIYQQAAAMRGAVTGPKRHRGALRPSTPALHDPTAVMIALEASQQQSWQVHTLIGTLMTIPVEPQLYR